MKRPFLDGKAVSFKLLRLEHGVERPERLCVVALAWFAHLDRRAGMGWKKIELEIRWDCGRAEWIYLHSCVSLTSNEIQPQKDLREVSAC